MSEQRLSTEELETLRSYGHYYGYANTAVRKLTHHIDALERDLATSRAEIERLQETHRDWPRGSTTEAVDRIRVASESDDPHVTVDPADLRKLFSSADGLADNYSIVIDEITSGMLTKPTTDPRYVLQRSDELEAERFEEWLAEETEALQTEIARLQGQIEAADALADAVEASSNPKSADVVIACMRFRLAALSTEQEAR